MGNGKESSREQTIKRLFEILLLLVNSIGIVGALIEILEVPRNNAQDRILFWGVLFIFCAFSIMFWQGTDRRKLFRCGCACVLPYIGLMAYFRKTLFGGLFLAMQNAVVNLDERYRFHIVWPDGLSMLQETGWESGSEIWIITVSVLFFLFPLELLAGFLLIHGNCFWLFLGNALWLTAACACDRFPETFYLIFCVMGVAALLVHKEFEGNPWAGVWAVAIVVVLVGSGIGLIYRFVLPIADLKYEEGQEDRWKFYNLVNEEWIPQARRMLSDYGIGSGTDVTGAFNRQSLFAYTAGEVYQVTMDSIPSDVLYLKGYVGVTYGKKEWIPLSDRELETYYKEHGLELPENYGQLANISYMSVYAAQANIPTGEIRIEELGGKGSYSVYPYGALLTEDYHVHGDGSVLRKAGEYSFPYRPLSGILNAGPLSEPWRTLEEQYRQYVYDSFLEYPEGLELLAERLEKENIRTKNISQCVSDIMSFLKRQASYNLDAGKNPSGEDFVEYFLFDSHEGYCVHFASAAVLALRYFGIPARYVTGYMIAPSDFSKGEDGGYTAVVTGKHAHAWAEIYLAGKGWLPVEATPGMAPFGGDGMGLMSNREEQQSYIMIPGSEGVTVSVTMSPDEDEAPESVEPEIPDFPMEQDISEKKGALGENGKTDGATPVAGDGSGDFQEGVASGPMDFGADEAEDTDRRTFGRITPVIAGMVLLILIGFLGKYLHDRRRCRWHDTLQEAEARRRILLLYRNMRRAMRMAGCPEGLDADEEAFWQALSKALPKIKRAEYESFCAILEKASFGNVEPSEEEFRVICGLHDSLVKEVYETAPFYKKPFFGMVGCYL